MKVFNRRLFSALVTVGMLGVVGCGPDNEAEGQKLAPKLGDPGKSTAKAPTEVQAPPKTNADRASRGPQGGAGALKQGGKRFMAIPLVFSRS